MKNQYPEFKAISTDGKIIIQEGFVDLSTVDDDEQLIKFYDEQGLESYQPRNNPYRFEDKKFQVWEATMLAWIIDEQFIQYMWDFQDENKTIQRDGYTLVINEGDGK